MIPRVSSPTRASLSLLLLLAALPAQPAGGVVPGEWQWRSLGPANMSGRIVDLAVDPRRPATWFVATASGGLFKTTSAGASWTPVFDREATVSLGAVAVAPSAPDQVWVGTGEANARNSVSWGDGVYVSRDGGKSWAHAGLKESFQIGRIVVHPANPEVVFVAACGRLWGENPERGLYRTRDGGKSWELVLAVDARTGAIDVVIDPRNPDRLVAATYERARDAFDGNDPAKRWGPGSGIHLSRDGGNTWRRVAAGLPTVAMGRIGLTVFPEDPRILYAVIESERIGWVTGERREAASRPASRPAGGEGRPQGQPGQRRGGFLGVSNVEPAPGGKGLRVEVAEGGPAALAGLKNGDVIVALGGRPLAAMEDLMAALRAATPGQPWRLEVLRGEEKLTLQVVPGMGGGRGGGGPAAGLGGQNENFQDRQEPRGFETGGIFRSDDGGESWRRVNSLNPRPFYYSQIRVDPRDPQRVYVLGTSWYGSSDGGKTFQPFRDTRLHPDFHALWIDPAAPEHLLLGQDAGLAESWDRGRTWRFLENLPCGQYYHVAVDDGMPYYLYGGLQDNGSWACPSQTRFGDGILIDDVFNLGGGDGFVCAPHPGVPGLVFSESQGGAIGWRNFLTGESGSVRRPQAPAGKRLRYNWDTPYLLSPHAPDVVYVGANYVIRAAGRGRQARIVSPEIARTDEGSATALAESPRIEGLLYAGTDDGALWATRDGGSSWQELTSRVPGLPGPRWVSGLEPSRHADGRVYLAFDGHRADDLAVYLFASEDFGQSWRRLGPGIDRGPVHEVREDPHHPDLLFAGTEFGVFASVDRGASWFSIKGNLPTVAVRDLAIQARERELAVATHGRGLFVLDIAGLEAMDAAAMASPVALLPPVRAVQWARYPSRSRFGASWFRAPNPPPGAAIHYWLKEEAKEELGLFITDAAGEVVRFLRPDRQAGLHALRWDFRREGQVVSRRTRRGQSGPPLGPGTYGVKLTLGDRSWTTILEVVPDPVLAGERR